MMKINNLKHYIAFQGDNSLNGNMDPKNRNELISLNDSLKKGEHNHLVAKFLYDGVKPKRADIDNILFYNLRIEHLEKLESFALEKRIEKNFKKYEYQFDFLNHIDEPMKDPIIGAVSIKIDCEEYKKCKRSFDRTKYLYGLFRNEILRLIKEFNTPIPLDIKECELYIEYSGKIEVKESTFLKPLIDGFISSLHQFKIKKGVTYDDKSVVSFIKKYKNSENECLIENSNGGYLLTAHNPPHFNPMDEMIKKLMFIKTDSNEEKITIKICNA